MKNDTPRRPLYCLIGVCALALTASLWGQQPPPRPQPDATPDSQGVSIDLRGPVHEAFAQPFLPDPVVGLEVAKLPPPPIEEAPPDLVPSDLGPNVEWVPGYWGWGEDTGFVWVSGCWRNPPPETRWLPGYWVQVEQTCRWVPGFWIPEDVDSIVYLPKPPPSREQGPIGVAPGANYFWIPGCWIYGTGGYGWRPGFWARVQENWVWIPAEYHWTPNGYVFVDGYWDFTPERCAVLFAPVTFTTVGNQPYTPTVVLDVPNLLANLFVFPHYCHYVFGDYYGPNYTQRGIYSWVTYTQGRNWHDPLLTFYQHARAPLWQAIAREHLEFARNPQLRPPHHWRDYQQHLAKLGPEASKMMLARPLNEAIQVNKTRFTRISKEQVTNIVNNNVKIYHELRTERQKNEFSAANKVGTPQKQFARWTLPHSAIPKHGIIQGNPQQLPGQSPKEFKTTPTQQPKEFQKPPSQQPKEFQKPPVKEPKEFQKPPVKEPKEFQKPPVKEPKEFQKPPVQPKEYKGPPSEKEYKKPPVQEPKEFKNPPVQPKEFQKPPVQEPKEFKNPPVQPKKVYPPPAEKFQKEPPTSRGQLRELNPNRFQQIPPKQTEKEFQPPPQKQLPPLQQEGFRNQKPLPSTPPSHAPVLHPAPQIHHPTEPHVQPQNPHPVERRKGGEKK